MSTIVTIIASVVALIWGGSVLVMLLLGVRAHRNDPAIVVDDPWERPEIRQAWERLRFEAVVRDLDRTPRRVVHPPSSAA